MGHLVDLPYSSVSTSDSNPMLPSRDLRLAYGGEDFEEHSRGQEEMWQWMLGFYGRHLGG